MPFAFSSPCVKVALARRRCSSRNFLVNCTGDNVPEPLYKNPFPRCAMADERLKVLESAIAQIEKQYGKGSIMRLGNRDILVPVSVIPTGCLSLDVALGVGGLPRGRVVEVYGPESGGKTTLTLLEIAETLIRSGGVDVVVVDSVAALVPKAELEGEMGEPQMGLQARLMSQAL